MTRNSHIVEVDESALRKAADILGKNCSSALAIADLERRRAAGEDAVIYQRGSTLLVGPRITQDELDTETSQT